MAGKDRKKQLARQRYERQRQRLEAERARARRVKIISAGAVAAVIVAGGAAIVVLTGGDDKKAEAKGKSGECDYRAAAKDAGAPKNLGKPSAKPLYHGTVQATIKTSQGDIGLALDGAKAPCATNSFAFLAKKGYWKSSHCHRLSTSAGLKMLQCGDPTGTGSGGPGYQFDNENTTGAKYTKGTLAMANAGPGTNGSQFFLVYGDSQLTPDYTVLGKITSGIEKLQAVADAGIAKKGDDGTGEPKKKVTIQDVTVAGN